jgi:hypothetical protein
MPPYPRASSAARRRAPCGLTPRPRHQDFHQIINRLFLEGAVAASDADLPLYKVDGPLPPNGIRSSGSLSRVWIYRLAMGLPF